MCDVVSVSALSRGGRGGSYTHRLYTKTTGGTDTHDERDKKGGATMQID